jgi:hypothetical protein
MEMKNKLLLTMLAMLTILLVSSNIASAAVDCSGTTMTATEAAASLLSGETASISDCCGLVGNQCGGANDYQCCKGTYCSSGICKVTPPDQCRFDPGLNCGSGGANCDSTSDCCAGYSCYYHVCLGNPGLPCAGSDCAGDCSGSSCQNGKCCGSHSYPCGPAPGDVNKCCEGFACAQRAIDGVYVCVWNVDPVCGDGVVAGKEQCERPNTVNNKDCCQTLSECNNVTHKLGTRDTFGNCGSTCGCNNDPFNYACVLGQCGATCDSNDDCAPKCVGNVRYFGGACDAASSCSCSWNTEDCDLKDTWEDTGETKWVYNTVCQEKQQKKQVYKDYSCAIEGCTYVNGSTRWVDTGNTSNKPYGTSCSDGQFCNGNEICNDVGECKGQAAVNCTGFNIFLIGTCDYIPDEIHFTWDHRNAFTSTCDEVNDKCTIGNDSISHQCSIEHCTAECDSTHTCAPNTCSETYNDYCVALKLADYNNNNLKDSKTVDDSCNRNCLFASCECTDCDVDCSAAPTEKCVPGVCGAVCKTNADCDDLNAHTIDTCLGDCTCKHDSTEFCGDGIVQAGETCELPGDLNDPVCNQTTSECLGKKLGTRDGFGNCDAQCGCDFDDFNYLCVKDSCGATCDDNSDCVDYCEGTIKHTSRSCDLSTSCSCSGGSTFDCNSLDGWYDTNNTEWVSTGLCTEKERKEQKERDYNCAVGAIVDCVYTNGSTQWIDTGKTRNKPNGTSCDDGLFCKDNDVCTNGQCGGTDKDCSGFSFTKIETCFNNPDNFYFTWDFRNNFTSVCDEANDKCTEGNDTITHTCDVARCGAHCVTNDDCYDKDSSTIDICAEDCVCEYTPIVKKSSGSHGGGGGSSYVATSWTCSEWSKCAASEQTRECALGSTSKTEKQACEMPVLPVLPVLPNVNNNVGSVSLAIEQPVVEEASGETPVSGNSAPEFRSEAVGKVLEENSITGAVTGAAGKNTPLLTGIFFLVLGGALLAFFLLKK